MNKKLQYHWTEENGIRTIRYGFLINPEDAPKEIKNRRGKFIEIYGRDGIYIKVIKKLEKKIIIANTMDEFQKFLHLIDIKNYNESTRIDIPPVFIDNENNFVSARIFFEAENDSIIVRFSITKAITKEEAEEIAKETEDLR